MKSHCSFSVVGMDLRCPLCGELVHSGSRHVCEKDGGISSRRTVPLERQKPLPSCEERWICPNCEAIFPATTALRAPNPWDASLVLVGCPLCKEIGEYRLCCDQYPCEEPVSCGWSSPAGYRRTCSEHYRCEITPG